MNHGYDDEEDDDYHPPPQAGPSGLLAQLMGGAGLGMGMGMGRFARTPPPSAYDEYFKAYSVAVMGGNERYELMYGGKIIMPPSALAKLSALDIPGPWCFNLRNPRNPTVNNTHAGVLEFIADEGIVHLPAWMMKTLGLNEGDPLRVTGAKLPKGKLVKLQAQSVDFLQVSDPKAVLESAMRNFSALSKNDIIEITYNSLTFEFLIQEIAPNGPGISVIDTDLEVDFDVPVGYVEPPRPAPTPVPTMADKLKIDLGETTSASAGSSRPASANSIRIGTGGGSGESTPKEVFSGVGQSLSGKKVKGKGLAKKIEEVDSSSRINRNDGPRIITPDSLADTDRKVPAALILPQGKLFFGFKHIPFDPSKAPKKPDETPETVPTSFIGEGNTLSKNRRPGTTNGNESETKKAKVEVKEEEKEVVDPWANLGGGNTLRPNRKVAPATTPTPVTVNQREVVDATMLDEDDFMFDQGDDDVIEIDDD